MKISIPPQTGILPGARFDHSSETRGWRAIITVVGSHSEWMYDDTERWHSVETTIWRGTEIHHTEEDAVTEAVTKLSLLVGKLMME